MPNEDKKEKEEKRKPGQRGKAKPITDVKKISYKKKEATVNSFIKTLEEREEDGEKTSKKITKKKPGRKPVINDFVLRNLKTCFAVGMTDEEACYFCKISPTAFYDFQKKNKQFTEEKAMLKKLITLQAKFNFGRVIKEEESKYGTTNLTNSHIWLKSYDTAFSPKLKVDASVRELDMTDEEQKMYCKILKNNELL